VWKSSKKGLLAFSRHDKKPLNILTIYHDPANQLSPSAATSLIFSSQVVGEKIKF